MVAQGMCGRWEKCGGGGRESVKMVVLNHAPTPLSSPPPPLGRFLTASSRSWAKRLILRRRCALPQMCDMCTASRTARKVT